jgi:hypothetical protein
MSREDAAAMFLPVAETEPWMIGDDGASKGGYGSKGRSEREGVEANASSGSDGTRGCNDKTLLRALRPDLSIRKGKFGPYIFYKTRDMSKPEFYAIKPIKDKWQSMGDLELIAWIKNTYRISI